MKNIYLSILALLLSFASFGQTVHITGGSPYVCVVNSSTAAYIGTPAGGTWSTTNTAIATMNASGFVFGVSPGTATIVYTVGGVSRDTTVPVVARPVISGDSVVGVGGTILLTGSPSGGSWVSTYSTIATVNSSIGAPGIVTGVTAGITTIVYTQVCYQTQQVTVALSAITGNPSVCIGTPNTFIGFPAGGTWSISPSGSATISPSGVVTGSGTTTAIVNITYTPTSAPVAVASITINPLPSPISGGNAVCVGYPITLSSSPATGAWTSSNYAVATVGTGIGIVTGVSPGTALITYTLPTGCFVNSAMAVNPNPGPITGTTTICAGASTTLHSILPSGSAAGVWTATPPATATIVSSTGAITGVAAGVANVTYTLATGCYAASTETINPIPTISGCSGCSLCAGHTVALAGSPAIGTWASGTPSVAGISSSGVVTGALPGSSVIAYTIPGGCTATTSVAVNPNPSAITGTTNICAGASTTLSSSPATGAWTCSTPAVGAIGSSSGLFISSSSGVAAITYTLPTGCLVTGGVTVNAIPAISGSLAACTGGGTSLLAGTPSGGTWSSSNTAIAGVGLTSGALAGVSPGTAVVTYYRGGCNTTAVVTTEAGPSPITGTMGICIGATTTLASSPGSGTWSCSPTTVANIGASTGFVTTVSPGVAAVSYTLSTGCAISGTLTVNAVPAISGPMSVCAGAASVLTASPSGGTWTSGSGTILTIGVTSGIMEGAAAGSSVINYFRGGCDATTTVNVNPAPSVFDISGGGTYCGGGSGFDVGLSSSETGTTYQLLCSGSPIGASVAGTGAAIDFGLETTECTYTASATNSLGCTIMMTGSATVGVSAQPVTCPAHGCVTCVGATAHLTDVTTGGSWSSSNTLTARVGSATGIVTGVSGGAATITYMLPDGCYVTSSFVVNPAPAQITGPGTTYIGGTIGLADATPGGSWRSSGYNASVNTSGLVTGISAGLCNITYTLPPGGCIAIYTITVDPVASGVNGLSAADGNVEVFPNPAFDQLTIRMDNGAYSSFTITNSIGQELMNQNLTGKETIIPLSGLSPAIYYITLRGESGIAVRRFVKI